MHQAHRGCRVVIMLVLLSLTGCATPRQPESTMRGGQGPGYRAELRATINGAATTSQVVVQGASVRIEVEGARRSSIMLVRYDLNRAWVLIPSQKRYVSLVPSDLGRQIPPFFKPGLRIQREQQGVELLDGQQVVRSRVSIDDAGLRQYEGMLWEEPAFPPLPVKWVDAQNRVEAMWVKRYSGYIPAQLFELPNDYQPLEPHL